MLAQRQGPSVTVAASDRGRFPFSVGGRGQDRRFAVRYPPSETEDESLQAWMDAPGRLAASNFILALGVAAWIAVAAAILALVRERGRLWATVAACMLCVGALAAFGALVQYASVFSISADYVTENPGEREAIVGLLEFGGASVLLGVLWIGFFVLLLGIPVAGIALLRSKAVPLWAAIAMLLERCRVVLLRVAADADRERRCHACRCCPDCLGTGDQGWNTCIRVRATPGGGCLTRATMTGRRLGRRPVSRPARGPYSTDGAGGGLRAVRGLVHRSASQCSHECRVRRGRRRNIRRVSSSPHTRPTSSDGRLCAVSHRDRSGIVHPARARPGLAGVRPRSPACGGSGVRRRRRGVRPRPGASCRPRGGSSPWQRWFRWWQSGPPRPPASRR